MLVYLILPILAYMLTGCSDDDDDRFPNKKVSATGNDKSTVFYGLVSGSFINMREVFTNVPNLTEIKFENGVTYYLVESTSTNTGVIKFVAPATSFMINGDQTITSTNSLLRVTTATGLTTGANICFTEIAGTSLTAQANGPITWNS
jgi:hypothetical protein